jgi:hypothetical protein
MKVGVGYLDPLARCRETRDIAPLPDQLDGESQGGQGRGGKQKQ